MPKVNLADAQTLTGQNRYWGYNALDCVGTLKIAQALLPRMNPAQRRFYAFERATQAPAFAMGDRGVLVDIEKRKAAVKILKADLKATLKAIAKLPVVVQHWDGLVKVTGTCVASTRKDSKHTWAKGEVDTPARLCTSCGCSRFDPSPFNPASTHQCAHLMYDLMGLKVRRSREGAVTTDDEALQSLSKQYVKARDLCNAILDARGVQKQIGFMKARLTANDRFPSTFSVGQAWTGRWSASKNPHKEGGNAQNITEKHRNIFVADPGMELCYADLKQAESNLVAHISGDEGYIEAHASGDVHTFVTRLIWPDMLWTGDLKQDKVVAKNLPEWDYVEGHDFRFQAKRVQHGSNYGLTPFGIAIIAHIPVKAAENAQGSYFKGFPGIREWQQHTARTVHDRNPLIMPLEFEFTLFGRPWDDHTVKQGLSLLPQGTVAHIINIAAWRVWKEMDPNEVEVLAQIHDALLFQFPKGRYDIVRKAVKLMTIPISVTDIHGVTRVAMIEVEAACGNNWGHKSPDNEAGIQEIEL